MNSAGSPVGAAYSYLIENYIKVVENITISLYTITKPEDHRKMRKSKWQEAVDDYR